MVSSVPGCILCRLAAGQQAETAGSNCVRQGNQPEQGGSCTALHVVKIVGPFMSQPQRVSNCYAIVEAKANSQQQIVKRAAFRSAGVL